MRLSTKMSPSIPVFFALCTHHSGRGLLKTPAAECNASTQKRQNEVTTSEVSNLFLIKQSTGVQESALSQALLLTTIYISSLRKSNNYETLSFAFVGGTTKSSEKTESFKTEGESVTVLSGKCFKYPNDISKQRKCPYFTKRCACECSFLKKSGFSSSLGQSALSCWTSSAMAQPVNEEGRAWLSLSQTKSRLCWQNRILVLVLKLWAESC